MNEPLWWLPMGYDAQEERIEENAPYIGKWFE